MTPLKELIKQMSYNRDIVLETLKTKNEMKEGTSTTSNTIPHTIKTPNYVGGYRLGEEFSFQVNLTYKPNWFHRTMMKLCFGWEWVNL